jgi:hypothetical protein
MRRSPLHRAPPPERSSEPGYREWHQPISGVCAICGRAGALQRHHVVLEQHIRQVDPARVWDLRGSMLLGVWCEKRCHGRHHSAFRRLPASKLTPVHLGFMVELLGEDRAAIYVARYYAAA